MLSFDELTLKFPDQIWLEFSEDDRKQALSNELDYSRSETLWNAYLNCLCLNLLMAWFQEEDETQPLVLPERKALPSIWEVVNGTGIQINETRFVIIPSLDIDTELSVPAEWVDISSWVAHYYLAVQINFEDGWLRVWGYASHQQLKNQGKYDEFNRTYSLDTEDLIEDLNVIWVMQKLRADELANAIETTPALPSLSSQEADNLLSQLSQPSISSPRLEVEDFRKWAALLENSTWRQQLYERRRGRLSMSETPSLSFSSFVDYKKTVSTLVKDLKRLQAFSQKLKLNDSVKLIEDVVQRVESDSFSVAVVGEFKRGKSTFINALLGQEILPSDIMPCSATINRVKYGLTPSVKVQFKDDREENYTIDKLADYVTNLTPESMSNAENVKEAVVYYPVPYCQNNIELIDTPGLGDSVKMTEITLSVLPQADVAIMVILAQAPFSESERDFLENKLLTHDLGRIIFVVNGIDRFERPEDTERVLKHVENRIQKYVLKRAEERFGKDSLEYEVYLKKIGKPKIFGLSAYQYLKGKQKNDETLLVQSRFDEFASALEKLLTQERGTVILHLLASRKLASAIEILKTITVQENALSIKNEHFLQAYTKSIAEIQAIRSRKTEELHLIDRASLEVKYQVQPLLYRLETELKREAERVIEMTEIHASEFRNMNALTKKICHKVSDAMQKVSQKLAETIQLEIQHSVIKEVERLQDFSNLVNKISNQIEMEFVDFSAEAELHKTSDKRMVDGAFEAFTGLKSILTGWSEVGLKGATVSAKILGTAFAARSLTSLIGLSVNWSVALTVGVLSIFHPGFMQNLLLNNVAQIQKFKEIYKAKILQEITKQLQESKIEQIVNGYISDTFTTFKQKVDREVEALLDNIQNTLVEMHQKRDRNECLTVVEHKELSQMRFETVEILENLQQLSEQLV
ncbi:DUF1822 family protein [Scytonema sp. UIC 10036]|uniref:DUF1822 family protein n=1 Tax=Scytonema sp. UIC 10036 TaxID=2304196 RepID=UPI0012DAE406|nr:DUF1822 family protein [Scytonema sp. UIC 10036]MUG98107.1 DUF1822 family protein [Scytonema sp. UIC 10036]